MLDASDWNATNRPSAEIAGLRLAPLAAPPPAARLTSVTAPVSTLYRKTSDDLLRSRATRLVARDAKATKRPSALTAGITLASSGGGAAVAHPGCLTGSHIAQIDDRVPLRMPRRLRATARVPEDGRRRERHIAAVPTGTRHHASTRMLRAITVHADAFDHVAAQIEAVDVRLRAVQVVLMHQVGGHRGKHDGARGAVDHGAARSTRWTGCRQDRR